MTSILSALRALFGRRTPRDPLAYDRLDPEIRRLEREGLEALCAGHGRIVA